MSGCFGGEVFVFFGVGFFVVVFGGKIVAEVAAGVRKDAFEGGAVRTKGG